MRVKKVDIDQYWKQLFDPLRSTPPLDPQIAAEERNKFLSDGAALRGEKPLKSLINTDDKITTSLINRWTSRSFPLAKLLVGLAVAIIILVGSSATVYAAQSSLPGEPLYVIKSWSEDIRISFANSPQTKLQLTLNYTDRRINEIASLIAEGEVLTEKESKRFENEMETALVIAAQMGDEQLLDALEEIKESARNQGMTVEELVNKLPEQAAPAIERLRERIKEQVRLIRLGEEDIQAFRNEIRERNRNNQDNRNPSQTEDSLKNPILTQNPNKPGNNPNRATGVPGNNNPGSGQDKPTQENGKDDSSK